MLTTWLDESQQSSLPNYTTHFVGVGGFVTREVEIDGKTLVQVLVVKEKNGPITSLWKVPGGMAEVGEDIPQVAVREVLEETGIQTEFECILGFRQHHGSNFHQSDLYFVCKLKAINFDIVPQANEISDARWMDVSKRSTIFMEIQFYHLILFELISFMNF